MRRPWPPCKVPWLWCCLASSGVGGAGRHCAAGLHVTLLPEALQALFALPLYNVGLAPGAVVSVNLTNALPSNDTLVVILSHGQWAAWVQLVNQHLWRPLPGGTYSSYLVSHWRQPFSGSLVAKHTICAANPDRYYVVVLNIRQEAMVLQGSVAYVNPQGQHLPLQLAHLPATLRVSSIAFVLLLLVIVLMLSFVWQKEATLLHALLVACVWLKSAELALKWKYFSVLEREGQAPAWLLQVWQLMSKLHEIFEIFFLLITALGWRVLRTRLTATEIHFTAVAMTLAAVLATLQVFSDAASAEPLVSFRLLFYVVRVMCYLVVIFAMNFNLQLIALHLAESPVTASVAVLYRKQQAYVGFRRIFLVIVFRPSALLWLQLSVLEEEGTQWAVDAFGEASAWLVYAGLFAALGPGAPRGRLPELLRAAAATGAAAAPGAAAPAPAWRPRPRAAGEAAGAGAGAGAGGGPAARPRAGADADLAAPYVRLAGGD